MCGKTWPVLCEDPNLAHDFGMWDHFLVDVHAHTARSVHDSLTQPRMANIWSAQAGPFRGPASFTFSSCAVFCLLGSSGSRIQKFWSAGTQKVSSVEGGDNEWRSFSSC